MTLPDRPEPFLRRHATGLTIGLFLAVAGGLGAAPVPPWLKPIELSSTQALTAAAERVLRKPKMTLADLEREHMGVQDDEDPSRHVEGGAAGEEPVAEDPDAVAAVDDEVGEPSDRVEDEAPRAPGAPRRRAPPSKQALRLAAIARGIDAPGADVENPCVGAPAPDGSCARTALDPFFAALDALEEGAAQGPARVLVLGNSLIASDHVTDVLRDRLVERFGDGGKGFLLPDRLSKTAGRRVRTGTSSDGWLIHTFAQEPPARTGFGFTGSMHETTSSGERTTWRASGATRARLFLLDHPDAPGFTLLADGIEVVDRGPSRAEAARDEVVDVDLPRGTKKVELVGKGPGLVVYGASFERDEPGAIVDTIGVPAASTALYLAADGGVFQRQVRELDPGLVVVMLGGNEIRSFSYGTLKPARFVEQYRGLLQRIKEAAPGAACLAVSPIDAVKATAAGEELRTRPEVEEVVAIERQVALEQGCAFFDLYGAMGGRGSLARMKAAGLLSEDLVHPTGKGGDALGHLLAEAFLEAYEQTPPPREPVPVTRKPRPPRLVGLSLPRTPSEAGAPREGAEPRRPLQRFFARLRALEAGEQSRVAVGDVGDAPGTSPVFVERLRARLFERFGKRGEGFVPSVGDPRRLAGDVRLRISGPHEIVDGRGADFGAAVGAGGVRARLEPGARMDVAFCARCPAVPWRGEARISWLHAPGMGAAEILVDGQPAAVLSAARAAAPGDVQTLVVPLASERAEISVLALEGGPIHVLGVSAEMDRRGVVVDALPLPGTTGMTPQRFRQDVFGADAAQRRWDLVVASWGVEESRLAALDEESYRHHLRSTLSTLKQASADGDCLVFGPPEPRGGAAAAPSLDLVERVQREVASELACAFFSTRKAQGGAEGIARWALDGLLDERTGRLGDEGHRKLADALVDDLLAAYAWDSALHAFEVASGSSAAAGPKKAARLDDDAQRLAVAGGGG